MRVGECMIIYDVSMTIKRNMKVYKNIEAKRPVLVNLRNHEDDGVYESKITMDLHTGTHMDAPLHMLAGGESIDQIAIEPLVTQCRVLDFTHISRNIGKDDLKNEDIKKGEFILFKTTNSGKSEFDPNFVYLDKSGAKLLMNIGVKDIERGQSGHETHKILFENNIYILEGLELEFIEKGEYILFALPLKIEGAEASPVRAILIKNIDINKFVFMLP